MFSVNSFKLPKKGSSLFGSKYQNLNSTPLSYAEVDAFYNAKSTSIHILLNHLVMLESQPSLNKDGAAVSSSSAASCLNREPGRNVSSALRRAAAGIC